MITITSQKRGRLIGIDDVDPIVAYERLEYMLEQGSRPAGPQAIAVVLWSSRTNVFTLFVGPKNEMIPLLDRADREYQNRIMPKPKGVSA